MSQVCAVCYVSKNKKFYFKITSKCSHGLTICTDCVNKHLNEEINEKMATREIKCPLQSCSQPFSRKDIRKWVTGDLYEKYNHYRFVNQIRRDPKFCACPFRDCLGYVLHDQKTKFPCVNCPKCNNDFCSVCKSEWHHEFTCKEAQAIFDKHSPEKKSLDFLQKNAKKCPKCQSPIIKSEGCDHITCTCNFQFCYSCLENWEECQKGKGHKEGCVFRWY